MRGGSLGKETEAGEPNFGSSRQPDARLVTVDKSQPQLHHRKLMEGWFYRNGHRSSLRPLNQ
jgi:hypothetical protein